MQQNMKTGLALLASALVIAAGALVALRLMAPLSPNPSLDNVNVLVIDGSTRINLTLSQLVQMNPIKANASYQNQLGNWRDYGTYEGVRLSTILETVGTVSAYDVVRVNATDAYSQLYSYDNLYPNATFQAIQGDLILAYAYNGSTPTDWESGPRIAFLPSDEGYSNDDANQTTPSAWYPPGSSGGSRWVYWVATIELLHVHPLEGSVNVFVMDGATQTNLTLPQLLQMNPIEANARFQNQAGNWRNYGTYEGVRLSTIIETVGTMGADDAVRVNATDAYSQLYSYDNLYPNATFYALQGDLILAYAYNGSAPPTWPDGPRIVFLPPDESYNNTDASQTTPPAWFPYSASGRCVRNVVTIELLHGMYPPAPTRSVPIANEPRDSRRSLIPSHFSPPKADLVLSEWRGRPDAVTLDAERV